jgi:hypothetical protein
MDLPAPYALVAARYDPSSRRVLVVSAIGNDAEDRVPLARARVRSFVAPFGTPIVDFRTPTTYSVEAALSERGVLVRTEGDEHTDTWEALSGHHARSSAPFPSRYLYLGPLSWRYEIEEADYSIERGSLRTPRSVVALGRGHRSLEEHIVRVLAPRLAFAISATHGFCGTPDHFVADRVDLATSRVERFLEGQGQPLLEIGTDHALYLQLDELRRYSDPESSRFEVLPSWLGLSSAPFDFNPYC